MPRSPTALTEVGRLAFRHEGEWWNAYWTPDQHSMERALKLGSIRITTINDEVRLEFMKVMRLAFEAVIKETVGVMPEWSGERPAPESERGGHG